MLSTLVSCRYFANLTMWVTKPVVSNKGMFGVCSIKRCLVIRGVCVLQQSTAWQYPFNGTECYRESSQQNLKITSATEGLGGTKPAEFMVYYLLEY